jgi:hypothetical protein
MIEVLAEGVATFVWDAAWLSGAGPAQATHTEAAARMPRILRPVARIVGSRRLVDSPLTRLVAKRLAR